MNTKDFVVLPWGKPGNSVKLKYKNARELRMEKVRLELENQQVEKKLQEFQSTKNKEKEERRSNGYHWKSGQVGKLSTQSHMLLQNKGNVLKFSAGKVKLKLLKQQLQETENPPLNYKMASVSESEKYKMKRKECGQCENKAALLVCLDCGEDYCSGCFSKIHQKGALKLHRTILLQAKSQVLASVLDVAHQFIKEANPVGSKEEVHSAGETSESKHESKPQVLQRRSSEAKSQVLASVLDVAHQFIKEANPVGSKEEVHSAGETSESKHESKPQVLQRRSSEVEIATSEKGECTQPCDILLCEGTFNEETSAQSFQEALNEWRTGRDDDDRKKNLHAVKADSLEECEVQTNLKIWREPLKIEFKEDSLSYMEKLWLKKHRRTSSEQLQNMLPDKLETLCKTENEIQHSQNENGEGSDDEDINVQLQTLFLPIEERKIERSEPALKIVELDDTYEENFEETRNAVPYKVELADAKSQQSCMLHDYQNFLYENYILQYHVFAKGKTDFLHLHLSSISYSKDNSKGENTIFEGKINNKCVDIESNQIHHGSCISFENKDHLPMADLEESSIKEKVSEATEDNLHEKPNSENTKTAESPLLLPEIARRSKPINEQYRGLERFFVFDKNERLNLLPSSSLECNYSSPTIITAGDREWIPNQSIRTYADNVVDLGVLQNTKNTLSHAVPPKRDTIGNDTDPSEKLHSLTSEELPAFHNHSLNISQTTLNLLKSSYAMDSCRIGELSSSGKDTKPQSLLTLSESSTDEEDENFPDNQCAITLPWSKST